MLTLVFCINFPRLTYFSFELPSRYLCCPIQFILISFHIPQATIDCLSVPRCLGNLLSTFRYYVLVTALSLSQACPHLDITTLRGYVAGQLIIINSVY